MQEYKKRIGYILVGTLGFLFPLINPVLLMIFFFGLAFILKHINSKKFTKYIHLFLITGFLLLTSMIIKFPLFIIGCSFAIATMGEGVSDIINLYFNSENNKDDVKIYSAKSSIGFIIFGSLYSFIIGSWIDNKIGLGILFFLSVLGSVTAAFLGSVTSKKENMLIPFGSAMIMLLFYTFSFSYNVNTLYLLQVLVFAFALGYASYKMRIADISAMLSSTLIGVVIIISTSLSENTYLKFKDLSWFFILLMFYIIGSMATHYKYSYKREIGVAQEKKGVRGYKNVFSNSLPALSLAVLYGLHSSDAILSAYLGSISTATGDTLASEIGQTYKGKPIMITTLKKTEPGLDGAISFLGELSAFFGAFVIAILGYVLLKQDILIMVSVVIAGFIATNIDSLIGATLQQKGYLSNNDVNLIATISGAIISGMIIYILGS